MDRNLSLLADVAVATEGMPIGLMNKLIGMQAEKIELILEKSLTSTDLRKEENRFCIPSRTFLREEEERVLEEHADDGTSLKGLEVILVDSFGEEHDLLLKARPKGKCALTRKWNYVVKERAFELGDTVKLWSFRSQLKLCFAIYKVP